MIVSSPDPAAARIERLEADLARLKGEVRDLTAELVRLITTYERPANDVLSPGPETVRGG
jgi:hypothetical protein